MANKTDKYVKIPDANTLEWLQYTILYLEAVSNCGLPEDMESTYVNLQNGLIAWTEGFMADIEIRNGSKIARIVDNNRHYIEIKYYCNGLISFNLSISETGCSIGFKCCYTYSLNGHPFGESPTAPSTTAERLDIIKKERIDANLDQLLTRSRVSQLTRVFVTSQLVENCTLKVRQPEPIKKQINKFLANLNQVNDQYVRTNELRDTLFHMLYRPNQMKEYIEDTFIMADAIFDTIKNHPEMIENNQTRNLSYRMRSIILKIWKAHELSLEKSSKYMFTNGDDQAPACINDMVRLIEQYGLQSGNYMPVPYQCNEIGSYYAYLKGYISSEADAVFQKYKDIHLNYNDCTMNPFCEDIWQALSNMFPELLGYKECLLATPIGNKSAEFSNIAEKIDDFISQIKTVTHDYDHQTGISTKTESIILPDSDLVKIVEEICTDSSEATKNSLPGYYAYAADFQKAYNQRPKAFYETKVNGAKQPDGSFRIDPTPVGRIPRWACNQHNSYYIQEPLKSFWKDALIKLIIDYNKNQKFNEKLYEELVRDFLKKNFPTKEDIEDMCADDTCDFKPDLVILWPQDSDQFSSMVEFLRNTMNEYLNEMTLVQDSLLKSNDITFLEWCLEKKIADKDKITARIEELKAAESSPNE